MGRKKKNLSWSGEKKKTYPHIEEGSLCHRPSNCNLSNLCGLYKSLAPEIVSWFLRFAESLAPPANSRAFGARASRSIFLAPPALVFGVNCLESSLWQRISRRGKSTPGTSVIPRGGGRPLSKGGYLFDLWQWHSHPKCSLQVDALNFKHWMEHVESLYLNHQNLRIY